MRPVGRAGGAGTLAVLVTAVVGAGTGAVAFAPPPPPRLIRGPSRSRWCRGCPVSFSHSKGLRVGPGRGGTRQRLGPRPASAPQLSVPDQIPCSRRSGSAWTGRVTDPNHGPFTVSMAELDEDRLVQIQPLTPKGRHLPITKVTSVTLTDTLGRTLTFSGQELAHPIWLAASVPAQVGAGVGGRLVTYSVKSVIIRGSNVVNSGQSRFTPGNIPNLTQPVWKIPVILYNLTIEANDLLAGAPAGKTALLTYPDHSVASVPLGPTHRVVLQNLPRGTYQLKVKGSLVPLGSTIRLSRSQTATQLLVTPGDAAEIAFWSWSCWASWWGPASTGVGCAAGRRRPTGWRRRRW